jgi:hypothetical protein
MMPLPLASTPWHTAQCVLILDLAAGNHFHFLSGSQWRWQGQQED